MGETQQFQAFLVVARNYGRGNSGMTAGRGMVRNLHGSNSIGRGRGGGPPRKTKEKRAKLLCSHCGYNGHEMKECFKLNGYPDWYKELKEQRANQSINMVENTELGSANFKGEQELQKSDPPDFAAMIQKEVAKYLAGQSLTSQGDTHSLSHLVDYSGIKQNTHFALSLLNVLGKENWILDTGASRHICSFPELIVELKLVLNHVIVHLPDEIPLPCNPDDCEDTITSDSIDPDAECLPPSQPTELLGREKGSRNKRKFRADPPLADPSKVIPLPSNECTSFEFSAEKFETHAHTNACNMCCVNEDSSDALKLDLGLSCTVGTSDIGVSRPRDEIEASGRSAIKKIIASGYSEEVATKAILRSGLWYGCKDTVSNVVDNTLAFLRSGQEIDPSREHYFEDLQQMEKYILAELVCLLREVRPFFSTGDAMWCLLICDMNVSHACAMDSDPLGSFLGDAPSNVNSSVSAQSQLRTELKSSESNIVVPCKPNVSVSYTNNCPSESEAPKVTNGSNLKSKPSFVPNGLVPDKDCRNSISDINEKPFTATGAEEKFVGSRKVSGISKREYILRQKSMHFEKHYRTYGSKGSSRTGKLSTFSGLVLDKKLKGVADSTGVNTKNSPFKINKAIGFDVPPENVNHNLSTNTGFTSVPAFGQETIDHNSSLPKSSVSINSLPSLPVADTELSLSFPSKSIANPMPISYSVEAANCSYLGSSNDKSLGQWARKIEKMR
ncbi:hypothetical protein DH2020_035825 [Rehmannia glutinosa]|uniref:PIR2-like helical domain-containing protein n=1 Tax=Rehmannia glutinosa TaxID=99300 RepID=A0ABR0V5K6_REHGL